MHSISLTTVIALKALVLDIRDREDAQSPMRAARRHAHEMRGGEGMRLDLEVGQRASRTMTVTAEHVQSYAEMTGDYNPLHFDSDFAAATRFGRLVAQGGLTTGILHALVAMDLPGPGTVFLSQDWKFTAPAYIGDTITGHAQVLSVHESKPVCQLGMKVERADGETVLEGTAWCYRFVVEDAG
jgi:acyl dehydratase